MWATPKGGTELVVASVASSRIAAIWFGEIEGLQASLAGAEQKLAAMRRIPNAALAPIDLGLPAVRFAL